MAPLRDTGVRFASAVQCTIPEPVPDCTSSFSQVTFVSTVAVQAHAFPVLIAIVPVDAPADGLVVETGFTM
jgi:hypothetical protein